MAKETKKTASKPAALKKPKGRKPSAQAALKPAAKPVYDEQMADAFIMEVDEEVKNDQLKVFWKKYGLFVVLLVVLVLSVAVSFETIKSWRENQFMAKTDSYIAANYASNPQEMLTALEKIASGGHGIYSELARIQIADILLEQGKTQDAVNMLTAMVDNDELNSRIRNLAAVKLAAQKLDNAPKAEIEALLRPVLDADDSWTPIAKEYLALASIQEGDIEGARALYEELLQDGRISDDFRARIQDMLTALADM